MNYNLLKEIDECVLTQNIETEIMMCEYYVKEMEIRTYMNDHNMVFQESVKDSINDWLDKDDGTGIKNVANKIIKAIPRLIRAIVRWIGEQINKMRNSKFEKQLQDWDKLSPELKSKIAELGKQKLGLIDKSEYDSMESNYKKLDEANQKYQKDLESERDDLAVKNKDLTAKNIQYSIKNRNLEDENRRVKSDLTSTKASYETERNKNKALQKELDTERGKSSSLEEENKRLRNESHEMWNKHPESRRQYSIDALIQDLDMWAHRVGYQSCLRLYDELTIHNKAIIPVYDKMDINQVINLIEGAVNDIEALVIDDQKTSLKRAKRTISANFTKLEERLKAIKAEAGKAKDGYGDVVHHWKLVTHQEYLSYRQNIVTKFTGYRERLSGVLRHLENTSNTTGGSQTTQVMREAQSDNSINSENIKEGYKLLRSTQWILRDIEEDFADAEKENAMVIGYCEKLKAQFQVKKAFKDVTY